MTLLPSNLSLLPSFSHSSFQCLISHLILTLKHPWSFLCLHRRRCSSPVFFSFFCIEFLLNQCMQLWHVSLSLPPPPLSSLSVSRVGYRVVGLDVPPFACLFTRHQSCFITRPQSSTCRPVCLSVRPWAWTSYKVNVDVRARMLRGAQGLKRASVWFVQTDALFKWC